MFLVVYENDNNLIFEVIDTCVSASAVPEPEKIF